MAVDEANAAAQDDIRTDVKLVHLVRTLKLPTWKVTDKQYAAAKADRLSKDPANHRRMRWQKKACSMVIALPFCCATARSG